MLKEPQAVAKLGRYVIIFLTKERYASFYKSYGRTLDERKADDITVSIVRHGKPKELFNYFKEHGYAVSQPYKGIYHVKEKVLFPTQVVVTRELEQEPHAWLRSLSR